MVTRTNKQLELLKDDVSRLAEQLGSLADATRQDAVDEAGAQLRRVRKRIDAVMSDATVRGREAATAMRGAVDDLSETIEESLQRKPWVTLAVAITIGIVVGAGLRRGA